MEETRIGTVYKHTTPSDKVYIGITSKDPIKRGGKSGIGYKNNKHFWSAIQLYTGENILHEVLYNNLTKQEACKIEQDLILFFKSTDPQFGYNNSIGGECSSHGVKRSIEYKEKLSLSQKRRFENTEARLKASAAQQKRFAEYRQNPEQGAAFCKSQARPGSKNGMFNKKHSNESKKLMSEHIRKAGKNKSEAELDNFKKIRRDICTRCSGFTNDIEERFCEVCPEGGHLGRNLKHKERCSGANNPAAKPCLVYNINWELITEFGSGRSAEIALNLQKGTVGKSIHKKSLVNDKYYFKGKEQENERAN